MTRRIISISIVLLSIIIVSCNSNTKSSKPRSIGNTSEILVVVENQKQWDNGIGKVLREVFGKDQYGLNQSEPIFKLSHVQKKSFSDLFKKHHNIFIVDIEPDIKEAKIETSVDLWSKPQRIFKVIAPSSAAFVELVNNNQEKFIAEFQHTDRERIMEVFRPATDTKLAEKVKDATSLSMSIPEGFYLAKSIENFVWVRKETAEFSQGIFIISDNYLDTAQFSQASIMSRINQGLKLNVPGAVYNSYMSTDDEFVPPLSVVLSDFLGDYAVKTTGIWVVENDFMGGPFVSYTFSHEATSKIVTLMAYVYKPNENKRDLLKQVEAIIYSTKK